MQIFALFDKKPKVTVVADVETSSTQTVPASKVSSTKLCVSKICICVITMCGVFAVITLGSDLWNPWNRRFRPEDSADIPELFLCAPTPYQQPKFSDENVLDTSQKIEENLFDSSDDEEDFLDPDDDELSLRYKRSTANAIRRIIRPLSLPPAVGFTFDVDPPLLHDAAARCSWSEFRKKRIPGLETDSTSFDYQLLDLSNCTDASDCRRFCMKLYKPNDPNICNYIVYNRQDRLALFFAIDPLLSWNLTDDNKIDSYAWNCESLPRCDWYWVRRQKLKTIDLNDKPENLIGQVRCRDFGACQRLCESHPSCNYVVMPTNNTKYGPSYLYTVPNDILTVENYSVDEMHDSFEIVCREGQTPPPVLSPRDSPPTNGGKVVVVETNSENVNGSASPNNVPSILTESENGTINSNVTDSPITESPVIATTPVLPDVITSTIDNASTQSSSSTTLSPSSIATTRKHGRRKLPQGNGRRQSAHSLKTKRDIGEKGLGPLVRRCLSSGTQTECEEMTSITVDKNQAQCLRISLKEEQSKTSPTDLQIQLYIRQRQRDDWSSNGLWLSVRHPSNPSIQEDVYLKPSVKSELEIVTKSDAASTTNCRQKMSTENSSMTVCKESCKRKVVAELCGCKSFKMPDDSEEEIRLCDTSKFRECSKSDSANLHIAQCLEDNCKATSGGAECEKYKYTISLKSSTTDDEAATPEANILVIDVTVAYQSGFYYNSSDMISVYAILGFLAFLYFASFLYCFICDKKPSV